VVVISPGPRDVPLQPGTDPKAQGVVSVGGFLSPKALTEETEALNRRLQRLDLRNRRLCDDGVWALASQISSPGPPYLVVEALDLSFNALSDEGLGALSSCLPLLPALKSLGLCGNGFGPDGARALCSSLRGLGAGGLRRLELSGSRLGDEGLEAVGGWLTHNPNLHCLFLDACLLGDDAMGALETALTANKVRAWWVRVGYVLAYGRVTDSLG